jgi:hypothetical protein
MNLQELSIRKLSGTGMHSFRQGPGVSGSGMKHNFDRGHEKHVQTHRTLA